MLQLALNGVEMSCSLYLLYKLLRFMKHVRFVTRSTGTRMVPGPYDTTFGGLGRSGISSHCNSIADLGIGSNY